MALLGKWENISVHDLPHKLNVTHFSTFLSMFDSENWSISKTNVFELHLLFVEHLHAPEMLVGTPKGLNWDSGTVRRAQVGPPGTPEFSSGSWSSTRSDPAGQWRTNCGFPGKLVFFSQLRYVVLVFLNIPSSLNPPKNALVAQLSSVWCFCCFLH